MNLAVSVESLNHSRRRYRDCVSITRQTSRHMSVLFTRSTRPPNDLFPYVVPWTGRLVDSTQLKFTRSKSPSRWPRSHFLSAGDDMRISASIRSNLT